MGIKDKFKKVFGTKHGRTIKKLSPIVARVNALEGSYTEIGRAHV